MHKYLTFSITLFLLTSCISDEDKFIANWVDKKYESEEIIIEKNDDYLTIIIDNKKLLGKIENDILKLTSDEKTTFFIDKNGSLIFEGNEFINKNDGIKRDFLGRWKINSGNSNIYDLDSKTINIEKIENLAWINLSTDNGLLKSNGYKEESLDCNFYHWSKDGTDRISMKLTLQSKDTLLINSYKYKRIAIRIE